MENVLAFVLLAGLGSLALCQVIVFGYSGPPWERDSAKRWCVLWNAPAVILLYSKWKSGFAQWPVDATPAVYLASTNFLTAVVLAAATHFNVRWTHTIPKYLREIALWRMDVDVRRAMCRGAFYLGVFLAVAHLATPPKWVYWPAIVFSVVYLLLTLPTAAIEVSRACRRLLDVEYQTFAPAESCPLFISYRSVNSNVVRAVVDRLFYFGVVPWFAEYTIRFCARDQFQQMIDSAIDHSRCAVLFTNDKYVESSYCQAEVHRLFPIIPQSNSKNGPRHEALEFRIPNEPRTRQILLGHLEGVDVVDFQSVDDTVQRILQLVGSSVHPNGEGVTDPTEGRKSLRRVFSFDRGGVTMNVADWEECRNGARTRNADPVLFRSQEFRRRLGRNRVAMKFQVLPAFAVHARSSPEFRANRVLDIPRVVQDALSSSTTEVLLDDRWLLDSARNYMMLHTSIIGAECHGVHLFWWKERPHLVLTYWQANCWVRRYLLRPVDELCLDLKVRFWGNFREYCGHTHEMDYIVNSIEFHSDSVEPLEHSKPLRQLPRITTGHDDDPFSQAFALIHHAESADELRQAESLLRAALAANPSHAHAWNELRYVLSRLGEWHEAIASGVRAMQLEPDNPKFVVGHLACQVDAAIETISPSYATTELVEMERQADALIARYPYYPSVYAIKAQVVALLRGDKQSEWEGYLDRFAEAFTSRSSMQSGLPISHESLGNTLITVASKCIECSVYSSLHNLKPKPKSEQMSVCMYCE